MIATARALSPGRALLYGTLTVGALDLLAAIALFGLRGVPPIRIPQSIASGVMGRAAYGGGIGTALLGTLLHFLIAFGVVAVYFAASRRWPALARSPLVFGALYGVLVYAVMNLVVVPLSAAVTGPKTLGVVAAMVAIHILVVGLPSALFARAARPSPVFRGPEQARDTAPLSRSAR